MSYNNYQETAAYSNSADCGPSYQHYSSSTRQQYPNPTEQIASDLLNVTLNVKQVSNEASQGSYDFGGGGGGGNSSYQSQSYANSSAGATTAVAGSTALLSQIEQAILRSNVPIDINETEEITVNGQRGIWANKSEVVNWRGLISIAQYQINEDSNPEIITKRSSQQVEYIQELGYK